MPRRSTVVLLFLAIAFAASGCHGKKKDTPTPSDGGAVTLTASSVDAAAPSAKAASSEAQCPAADREKLAPFVVDHSAIKAAVPEIEDSKEAMASFYDKVIALARGKTGRDHVRIGVYGDSNLTSDHLTGHMRRQLQARFGDGGHGFVALARPWAWYTHEDVHHHGTWPLFKQMDCTTDPVPGHRYGFANMAAESSTGGAAAWVGTADASSPVGTTASEFDVYFMKQPRGGSFDLVLDKKVVRTVSTKSDEIGAGFEKIETTDEAHELKCVVKGDGVVRLFGATLERSASSSRPAPAEPSVREGGIVVDSLGTGAMNFQRFMLVESEIRKAQLEHRKYDLVIVWLGMNSMWLYPNRAWVHDTITTLRDALPGLPVLMLTPPDSVKMGESKSDPRIVQLVKQLREVSEETGAAFWDFRAAMGGDAAYLDFMKRGLAANDRAHLSKTGNEVMGQRLLAALFQDIARRIEKKPDAGCSNAK